MADDQRWKKRVLRKGPIVGLMALVLAICCVAAAWRLLIYFDGRPVILFPQLSTFLGTTATLAGVLIRFSIGVGLAIHWWRLTLIVQSVATLHRQWKVGTGILCVLKTPRGFGLVSIVIIARTLLSTSNPVLLNSIGYSRYPRVYLTNTLAERLPSGWAGVVAHLNGLAYPSPPYNTASREYFHQDAPRLSLQGCKGTC